MVCGPVEVIGKDVVGGLAFEHLFHVSHCSFIIIDAKHMMGMTQSKVVAPANVY